MITTPAAIEGDQRNSSRLGALGDGGSDFLGGGQIAAVVQVAAAHFRGSARRGGERPAGKVVDQLRVNVLVAAEHRQPRTFRSSENTLANRVFAALEAFGVEFVFVCHTDTRREK